MKNLLPTTLLFALFLYPSFSQAQNNRWMYLAVTDDKAYLFVDTISSEIIQDKESTYLKSNGMKLKDYGTNTVIFWTMFYEKSFKNKKSIVKKHVSKIMIDTVKKRYQSSSMIYYENNKVIDQDNSIIDWVDVIPGTLAELFVKFGKSVNNSKLKQELEVNAYLNQGLYPNVNQ